MNKKLVGNMYVGMGVFSALICIGFIIQAYFVRQCQNKYGLNYNIKRKELGIPIIPNYWNIKERDDESVWWTGDEDVIGHKRKSVIFSGCDISGELDIYNLPLKDGKRRLIEIEYKYGNKIHNDSVSYSYQIDHSATMVSKNLIDSILTAEKIKKDY